MKDSITGSLAAFNITFADGQCLLLTRDAMGLVETIRAFGESHLAEFSISSVDESSFEEMCVRSNAQVFVISGRETEKQIRNLTALPQGRNAARVIAWEGSGAGPARVRVSNLVQIPISNQDSIGILFSIVSAGSAPDVFISYSRTDAAFVESLNARLRRFGLKTWLDTTRIRSGEIWMDAILCGIRSARTFLFVITPESVKSKVGLEELDFAVKNAKRLFTVLRWPTPDNDIPEALARIQRFPFVEEADFDSVAKRLYDDVLRDADFERWAARVLVQASDWVDRGRSRDLLLSKAELRESTKVLNAGRSAQLPPITVEYLAASRSHLNRTRAAAAASVLALGAAFLYLGTWFLSLYFASESNNLRADNPESGLQFAKLAVESRQSPQALSALRASLVESREATYIPLSLGGAFQKGGPSFIAIGVGQAKKGKLESLIEFRKPGANYRNTLTVPAIAAAALVDRAGQGGLLMTVIGHTLFGCLLAGGLECLPLDSTKQFLDGAAFSPDGKVAAALRETGWEVWSLPERKLRFSFPRSASESVVFAPDGASLYHTAGRGKIEQLDAVTGRTMRRFDGGEDLFMLRLSPDGKWLLQLHNALDAILNELSTGKRIALRTGYGSYFARFSRSGKYLAVATPSSVLIFATGTETPVAAIPVETGAIGDIDFRPDDGAILLAIGKNAEVYSLIEEKRLLTRLVGHELALRTAMFDQAGTRALTWGDSSTRVWDLSPERNEVSFVAKGVVSLAFSMDGQELAINDGLRVRVTRVADGHLLRTIPLMPTAGPVLAITYSRPREHGGKASGRLTLWDEDTAALLEDRAIGAALQVCFSQVAREMAILRPDQSIARLGYSDGKMLSSIPSSGLPVQALGCSANGRSVAEGTWNPNRATFRDTQTRRNPVQTSLGITTVAALDRSTRFQVFSDFLHNLSIVTATGFYENSAANGFLKLKFNNDGTRVLSVSDFAGRVWDTETGDMVQLFRGRYGATDASWSADGHLVATAHASDYGDQAVCIWDSKSGALAAEIPSLHTAARIVEFSPDGRRLAVADADGVVHIYARERFAAIPEIKGLFQQRTSRPLEIREWKLSWLWR